MSRPFNTAGLFTRNFHRPFRKNVLVIDVKSILENFKYSVISATCTDVLRDTPDFSNAFDQMDYWQSVQWLMLSHMVYTVLCFPSTSIIPPTYPSCLYKPTYDTLYTYCVLAFTISCNHAITDTIPSPPGTIVSRRFGVERVHPGTLVRRSFTGFAF